jgi:ribose 5-phosphate isomerase B
MTTPEPIAIAADQGGFELKKTLIAELEAAGFKPLDLGTHSTESVDYPDMAENLVAAIKAGKARRGVIICGTGIGISIAANRHHFIRAALCHNTTDARLTRQHNDANVLALGGRTIGVEVAKDILRTFLATEFEGGRHARRVAKLGSPEKVES